MVDAITRALSDDVAPTASVAEFAKAQVEMLRIRTLRAAMIVAGSNPHQLRRLTALDRYERYARAKRRRALVTLD